MNERNTSYKKTGNHVQILEVPQQNALEINKLELEFNKNWHNKQQKIKHSHFEI